LILIGGAPNGIIAVVIAIIVVANDFAVFPE
jgi:hypothetical protein